MPLKFMPVKVKQGQEVGDTNWLINTLYVQSYLRLRERINDQNKAKTWNCFTLPVILKTFAKSGEFNLLGKECRVW